MSTSWKDLVQIDKQWVTRQLNHHFSDIKSKLAIRAYTLKASGTTITPYSICSELSPMLIPYVSGKKNLSQKESAQAHSYAIKFFGQKNTQTDGKYGELLLFGLVESVLECKMVAHKIRTLTNFKDQVKGGDGIFLGEYEVDGKIKQAYMIGESKVMGKSAKAIGEALSSLDRFHDPATAAEFYTAELIIAKDNLIIDESADLDEMYKRLTPSESEFHNQVLVHPVVIMYNAPNIEKFEKQSEDMENLEDLIKKELSAKKDAIIKTINSKVKTYNNIQKVYLDFFIIPTNNVDSFRNAMYFEIHGVPYKP